MFSTSFQLIRPSVKLESKPAAVPYIGWQVEPLRLATRTVNVLAKRGLAADRDNSVSVVIVEEIGEHLLANTKVSVVAVYCADNLRERHTQLAEAVQPMVLSDRAWHGVGASPVTLNNGD